MDNIVKGKGLRGATKLCAEFQNHLARNFALLIFTSDRSLSYVEEASATSIISLTRALS
jgi:hypothetical protein